MRLHSLIVIASVAWLAAVPAAHAQETSPPDITGVWTLSIDSSDFGMSPPPDSARLEIERADDRIVMTRTSYHALAGGANSVVIDMPADGQTHEATTSDGPTDASVQWDGDTLVMWIVGQSNVGDVDITERWAVEAEAKQLTIDREIVVPGMTEFEQVLVFDRTD